MFNATNCGDICLPGYVFNFFMRDRFDVELAEVIKIVNQFLWLRMTGEEEQSQWS